MINWEKLYNKLLEVKVSKKGEKHHVIPKHDGGKDEDGLVILERRYHILAHYIRFRWKGQIGDRKAAYMMAGNDTYYWQGLSGKDHTRSKIIFQIDYLTGKTVNFFHGGREVERETGISFSKVCEVCNGNRDTAGGYKWMYLDNPYSYIIEHKKVVQKSKTTKEVIAEFSNGNDAGNKTGVDKGDIWRVINGKQKSAGGFIWEEEVEYKNIEVKLA